MGFLLHVGRLPLAISWIVSRNRILCEAALINDDINSVFDGTQFFLHIKKYQFLR